MKLAQTLFVVLLFLSSTEVVAQQQSRKQQFNIASGVAIKGFDPVSYFTLQSAVKGDKANQCTVDGVTYYFSTIQNRDLFKKNPAQYEPQYGGWCAYAMGATNEKVEIDPETFKIVDGKLYLFYNAYFTNTLPKWNKDEHNLKSKADSNWLNLFK